MKTEPGSWLVVVGIALMVGCVGSAGRRGGWPKARVRALPANIRDAYGFFAARCSRCHTLSRPLSAGIADPEHWRRYVARMRRMPGAGISSEDAQRILTFLEYHAGWVRRQKADGDWFETRFGDEESTEEPSPPGELRKDDAGDAPSPVFEGEEP